MGSHLLFEHHKLCRMASRPVEPHITLGFCGFARLCLNLQCRFVGMENILIHKPLSHFVVNRRHPIVSSTKQPVGHGLSRKLGAGTVQSLLLLIQWGCHDKLLHHDMGSCLRRSVTAGDHGRNLFCLQDRCLNRIGLAFLTSVSVINILPDRVSSRTQHEKIFYKEPLTNVCSIAIFNNTAEALTFEKE